MQILEHLYSAVWGIPTLLLILLVGAWLTVKTRFAQLTLLPQALRDFWQRLWSGDTREGTSSFQALCTALAATVGTGNLAGVAGAIALGGPGAIFWMWICALLGMIIKFSEATLAVSLRQKNAAGEWVGGPMYMIRYALPPVFRPLAGLYAFFGVVAAFGVGNATQINTVICSVSDMTAAFGLDAPAWLGGVLGLLLAALVGAMLLGGARRIGTVAEKLVPFGAAVYLLLCLTVLIARIQFVPAAFSAIFRGALAPRAVTGGMIGSMLICLRTGVSRGIFTNEAGMGTASIAHAAARVEHPVEQGMMGIVEVFLDTVVICTMTALVILCSRVSVPYGVDPGVTLTTQAFSAVLGGWVSVVISMALCLFALATVLGWGLYGIRCAQYLFGENCWKLFASLQIVTAAASPWIGSGALWRLAEIVNGLMAIPNLIVLCALTPRLQRLRNEYQQKKAGNSYAYFRQCQSL